MKLVFLIVFTLSFWGTAQAQKLVPSKFYKSLSASINTNKVDSIFSYHGFAFSILIKTNSGGEIISIRENDTMDAALTKLISYMKDHLDRRSLLEVDLRNKALLIPVVLLNYLGPDQQDKALNKQDLNIWAFKGEDLKQVQQLEPLIVQFHLTRAKSIDN